MKNDNLLINNYALNILKALTKEQFNDSYNLFINFNLELPNFIEVLNYLEKENLIIISGSEIKLSIYAKEFLLKNRHEFFIKNQNFAISIPEDKLLKNNKE